MRRKKDIFSQTIVGIFMMVIMLLLSYFTIVVSGVDVFVGRNRRSIRIAFDHVGGLKDHDNVMYRGTKVGTVEKVEVSPSNLVVVAIVDEGVVLRNGYRVAVGNLSMLGGNFLILEEGTGDILDVGTEMLHGETPSDWMQDMSKIAKNLNELTSKAELHTIITNFQAVSEQVKFVSEKAAVLADRIERGQGLVGKLLSNDDTVYNDFKSTVANAKEISDRLNRAKMYEDLECGVAAFRKSAEGLDARELVAKANQLIDSLNAVANDLKGGNGTLGKLAKDPELYNQVNGLIRDVRQVIDNYRDTTPISTFSSLAIGAF